MKPKVLKTEEDHRAALSKVESLMNSKPGSSAEAELELWSLLVEHYERLHHPIDPPDPIEAIRFRMEQEGLRDVDMTRYFKTRGRVSEVLSRKRKLTLPMIRALSAGLHIPAAVLIRDSTKGRSSPKPKQKAKRQHA